MIREMQGELAMFFVLFVIIFKLENYFFNSFLPKMLYLSHVGVVGL